MKGKRIANIILCIICCIIEATTISIFFKIKNVLTEAENVGEAVGSAISALLLIALCILLFAIIIILTIIILVLFLKITSKLKEENAVIQAKILAKEDVVKNSIVFRVFDWIVMLLPACFIITNIIIFLLFKFGA